MHSYVYSVLIKYHLFAFTFYNSIYQIKCLILEREGAIWQLHSMAHTKKLREQSNIILSHAQICSMGEGISQPK